MIVTTSCIAAMTFTAVTAYAVVTAASDAAYNTSHAENQYDSMNNGNGPYPLYGYNNYQPNEPEVVYQCIKVKPGRYQTQATYYYPDNPKITNTIMFSTVYADSTCQADPISP